MALNIKQLIQDKSGDRDYFAMVPGLLWPDIKLCSGSSIIEPLPVHVQEIGIELNVHDKWLYASLKKICGETGGQCFLSTRGLAKFAGMSTGQTSKSKAKLEEVGLIEIICKKRSVRGQAIDHITVVDIWEENIKIMKARKEGVHLVNALREKQERSQGGEERSSDEHLSPERSPNEAKRSPSETEEEPIEEEPRDEGKKEEEPPNFPEKPKERTDDEANSGHLAGHSDGDSVLHTGAGKSADAGELAIDFHVGRSSGDSDTLDPLTFDLDRHTLAERKKAGGNPAVPPSAGGDDAVAEAGLIALHEAKGGSAPREGSGTYVKELEVISLALRDRGETAPEVARLAAQMFVNEKPRLACPHYKSFVGDYGEYLGRAKKRFDKRRERTKPLTGDYGTEEDFMPIYMPELEPLGSEQIPWNLTLDRLKAQVGQTTFFAYYQGTRLVSLDDGTAVISARNEGARGWLQARAKAIGRELSEVLDRQVEVEFEVET